MTQMESGPARYEAAPDYMTRLSPIGSAGCRHFTSAAPVAHRVRYFHTLAHVLTRVRFHGTTTQGALYYSIVDDPTSRRLHLNAHGLRIICPDETPHTHTRDRLKLDLIHHGATLLCEIYDLIANARLYGITDSAALRHEIDALITAYTTARIRNTLQDANAVKLGREVDHHARHHRSSQSQETILKSLNSAALSKTPTTQKHTSTPCYAPAAPATSTQRPGATPPATGPPQ